MCLMLRTKMRNVLRTKPDGGSTYGAFAQRQKSRAALRRQGFGSRPCHLQYADAAVLFCGSLDLGKYICFGVLQAQACRERASRRRPAMSECNDSNGGMGTRTQAHRINSPGHEP